MAGVFDEMGLPDPNKSSGSVFDDLGLPKPEPAPKPQALPQQTIGDYAKRLGRGAVETFVTAPGALVEMAGGSPAIRRVGQGASQSITETMSPQARELDARPIYDEGLNPNPVQKVVSEAIESVPSMAASLIGGLPFVGVAGKAGGAVTQAATRMGVSKGLASAAGTAVQAAPFSVLEGVQAGASSAADIMQRVEQTPLAKLYESPEFNSALAKTDAALPLAERESAARAQLAHDAAVGVFGPTTAWTGGVGFVTGAGGLGPVSRALTGRRTAQEAADGIVKTFGKDALKEGVQEFPQSGGEKYLTNRAVRDYIDPTQDVWQGVGAAAVEGGLSGSLLGGVAGGATARLNRSAPPGVESLSTAPPVDAGPNLPAAPAEPGSLTAAAQTAVDTGAATAVQSASLAQAAQVAQSEGGSKSLDAQAKDAEQGPQPAAGVESLSTRPGSASTETGSQAPAVDPAVEDKINRLTTFAETLDARIAGAQRTAEASRQAGDLETAQTQAALAEGMGRNLERVRANLAELQGAPSGTVPTGNVDAAVPVSDAGVGAGLPDVGMGDLRGSGAAELPAAGSPGDPAGAAADQVGTVPDQGRAGPVGPFTSREEAQSFISQQRRMAPSAPAALPMQHEDGSFGVAMRGTPEYAVAQQQVESDSTLAPPVVPMAADLAPPAGPMATDAVQAAAAAPAPISQAGEAVFTQDLNAAQPEQVAGQAPAPQTPETLPGQLPAAAAPVGTPVVSQPAVAKRTREQVAAERKEIYRQTNPFKSFLATFGVKTAARSDVGGDKRKPVMVPYHGALFRNNGLNLDELARRAVESGFMTQNDLESEFDNGGVNKLSDMIRRQLAGENIQRVARTGDAAEAQYNEAAQAYYEAQAEAADTIVVHATDEEINALLQIARQEDAEASNEEIDHALDLDDGSGAQADDRGQVEVATPGAAPGGDPGSRAPPRAEGPDQVAFDLTAPTRDELAQADAQRQSQQAEQARRDAAPPADDFLLTGSNSAADQAIAAGQMELAPAEPQPAGARTSSPANTASWVIREKATGKVVMETFDRAKVDALNTAKYEAVPIQQYLGSINGAAPVSPAPAEPHRTAADPQADPQEAPAPEREQVESDSTAESPRARLLTIAKRLGMVVSEGDSGFHASSKDGAVYVPAEDAALDGMGAVSANHILAHELGHAVLSKRGVSFHGFPVGEARKQITNYDDLVAASKKFRPGVWSHENDRVKRHARKPNEVVADAIGSVLLGESDLTLLQPMRDKSGLTLRDLGLEDKPAAKVESDSTAKAEAKPLDHGELNIPGRTDSIDADLDKWKAGIRKQAKTDAKDAAAQRRADKAEAKDLFGRLGEAIIAKHGEKLGAAKVRETLDQMVKWEPAKFIELAKKFERENPAPASPIEADEALHAKLAAGTATVDEYRAGFENWIARKADILAIFATKKKDDLLRMGGMGFAYRYKAENKAKVVEALWRAGAEGYTLGRGYSYSMGDSYLNAVRRIVESTDADYLAQYARERKQAQEEAVARVGKMAEAIKDPKTLDDFKTVMRAHMAGGKSFAEARMMLTPEQRAAFDELTALESRGSRKATTDERKTAVRVAGQKVDATIVETKHTQKGHDLFVVQLAERVEREDYNTLNAGAKKLGGYYSAFRGRGAVPGFQFKDRAGAEAFVQLANGDASQAQEAAQERRDAFADDRSQSAVERLTTMADRLEERADEALGRDRKVNTGRRARMAAGAESAANADKALAKTMRNIAGAIGEGAAKFLDRVRQKAQVEALRDYVRTAHGDELRAKYPAYIEQERHKGEAPTAETADFATFPQFTAFRSDLATLARQLVETDGTKLMGQRILKVADDVSDAYIAFAKENFHKVSTFSTKTGGLAKFGTRDAAEAAIARSGYKGRAIAYQVKRGEYTVIMSPSEAIARGIWQGDGDKRITLDANFGVELVEKIGRAARRGAKVSVPWQFETAYERRKQLAGMGIETPAEFRAALREFIGLAERPAAPDRVRELERAMVGRRNDGLDFFPTPESVADEMVAAAGIAEGMTVLEPSAGMGHIAERIRAAGVEPDVVEMANDRKELLDAKGFNVIGRDFLEVTDAYDRIVMNPPFSDRRDVAHVQHAYGLLKPGGRLVAIMGEGSFFGQDKRAQEFRDWLEQVGGTDEKLDEGTFLDPSLPVNTGVNARMVVIDKPSETDRGVAMFSRQTQTDAFRRWFGDSKVVDAEGRPLVVYHGTPTGGFDSFSAESKGTRTGHAAADVGFHFTDAPDYAEAYSGAYKLESIEAYRRTFGAEPAAIKLPDGASTYPVYLSIKNPLRVSASKLIDKALLEQAKAAGHDGIIANMGGASEFVAFRPEQIKSAIGNRGTFDPTNPDIRASRGAGSGMPAPAVTKIADAIRAAWANGPEVVVVVDMRDAKIPQRVRDADAEQRSGGASGDPEGFFVDGKVYLVASALDGDADVVRVLMHESAGHYGLRGLFGDRLKPILEQIANVRRGEVAKKAREYGLDPANRDHQLIAAEEILAVMAQSNPQLGFVRKAIAAIRTWLREAGLNLRVTDDDIIAQFILPARAWVERGAANARDATQAPRGEPAAQLSRADAVKKAAADGARAIKGATLASTWKRIHNAWVDRRPLSIQLLGRRQIVEVYEKLLPELRAYSNEMQQYDADKNESAAAADEIVTDWRRLKDADQLADVMHGATLNEFDPERNSIQPDLLTPEMREVYDGWQALTPEAKAVYLKARDAYEKHWALVKKAIGERIERADISENDRRAMMEQYRDEFLKPIQGVYFPLARFGDYVITVKKDGVTEAVVFAETLTEAESERARLTKDFPEADVGKVTKRKEFNAARDSVSKDFVRKLYETVDKTAGPDSEALKDAINQLYLTSLPDVSWAKHGIHRKGTPGYNKDARRAFAANMFHGGYHVAKLRHADVLQDYLRSMQEHVEARRDEAGYDSVAAQQVIDEMVKRHDSTINPDNNPAANTATALGFIWHLGASPASALVNLSQTALVAYPIIAGKYGFGATQSALLKASKQALQFKNDFRGKLAGDENTAIERAIREGLIDITQAHDLASISEGRDSQLHGALSPVMRIASKLFHEAEKFNRQATFLAAYRLAKGAGESAESAYDIARDLTYRGHFDYAQSNRPRVMMGPIARVLLLFKQYGQNMIYTLGRNAFLAAKGDRQALRTLSGILVAHGLAAGSLGLPMASILFGLASLIGGSDDEPWDAEAAYRNYLADALGPTLGEMVARGVFRGVFPGDVSARVGLDSLLVRDIDLTLSPGKVHQEILNAVLGPVAGILVNMTRGAGDLAKGDVQRGVEQMLPKAIADGLKSIRYGMEGVKDRTGVDVLSEVRAHELAAQVLGFSPARVKEAYEGRRATLGKEDALKSRHNELLSDFARALMTNDDEARSETLVKIQRFNEANPTFAITRDGIKRSIQNRLRRQVEAQNGVYLPRKHRDLAEEGRFANTQ